MKKLLLKLLLVIGLFIITQPFYAQPKLDLVSYQKMYQNVATATKDTILLSDWEYCKFTITPTETDSAIQFSFGNFTEGDSTYLTSDLIWNQPDWIDSKIFPRLVIKGGSDYLLIIWGRKRP